MTATNPTLAAALAEAAREATEYQVHAANWTWWANHVLESGPAQRFVCLASPSNVLALLEEREALRVQRGILADAVCAVIGRPSIPGGECPICRQPEPCERDQPAITIAAGMFAGATEDDLCAALVEHP